MTPARHIFTTLAALAWVGCYEPPAVGNGDAAIPPPPDGGADGALDGGPDALPDAAACAVACADADTLTTCDGASPVQTTCALGCLATPTPHCAEPVLANGVAAGVPAGVLDYTLTCAGNTLTFGGDGQITRDASVLRAAGPGVIGGIGFHVAGTLPVYSFNALTLKGCTFRPATNRPLALVARGEISLDSMTARFDGALPPDLIPCSPGGSASASGGGGGGAAQAGGRGGNDAVGGAVCGSPFAGPKPGSMGGRGEGRQGGTPGGALQISSMRSISVIGSTFSFGGEGGQGALAGEAAGGGGSGGTLLLEAPAVGFAGSVYANGGGGGGVDEANLPLDGAPGADAVGPLTNPAKYGGVGGSANGALLYSPGDGTSSPPPNADKFRGGGGGGVGYFRIASNSLSLAVGNRISAIYSAVALPLQ